MSAEGSNLRPLPKTLKDLRNDFKIPENAKNLRFKGEGAIIQTIENDEKTYESFLKLAADKKFDLVSYVEQSGKETLAEFGVSLDTETFSSETVFTEVSLEETPLGKVAEPKEPEEQIQEQIGPFKGWTRVSDKQGVANNFGKYNGVYTATEKNGKEVRALFKTDKDKNVLLAEFLASALAYRSDPTRNPKVELAIAENEVYLSSQFYEAKTQDLYRFLGYKDRPRAIAEQSADASALAQETEYGKFVKSWINAPLGKETFAKLTVSSLKYGDRERHIGNLLIEGGDITKLRNIDHGAAFGQGAGFDEIIHPHKKLLGNILKRKATNHFLDYPLELRTSQEMAEEILRQTTEGEIEEDISEFKKSLDKAADKFSPEELKSFGKYLFKDIKFKENPTTEDILESINERFAETLKARASNLREFACEIALGRAVERTQTINGKKDFSKLSEDQAFMSVVKTNLTYFADIARGAKTFEKDVKDRTKVLKNLDKNQLQELVVAIGKSMQPRTIISEKMNALGLTEEEFKEAADNKKEIAQSVPEMTTSPIPFEPIAQQSPEHVRKMFTLIKRSYTTFDSQNFERQQSKLGEGKYDISLLSNDNFTISEVTGEKTKTSAIVAMSKSKPTELNIAFRGTKNLQNVLNDLEAFTVTSGFIKGSVHSGFYRIFRELWPQIKSEIDKSGKSISEFDSINIGGHSMGGAIAKICAYYLCEELKIDAQKMKITTVGDPRVFDTIAAKEYYELGLGERTLRIVQHRKDPVPATGAGFLGYKHVGQQLRVMVPEGYNPHQTDGYKKAFEQALIDKQFVSINTVSLFAKPVKLIQALREMTIGRIQAAWRQRKIEKGDAWSQQQAPKKEDNNSAEIQISTAETQPESTWQKGVKPTVQIPVETAKQESHRSAPKQMVRPTSNSISAKATSALEPTPKEAEIALDEIIGGLEPKKQINLSDINTLAELRKTLGIPADYTSIKFTRKDGNSIELTNSENVFKFQKNNLLNGSYQPISFTDQNGKIVKIEGFEFSSKVSPKVEVASSLESEPKAQDEVIPDPAVKPLEQSANSTPPTKVPEPQLSDNAKALAVFRTSHAIPEDAKFVVFTKPKFLGRLFESRKEIQLNEENISELHNFTRVGDKQDEEKERLGWKLDSYYVDDPEKSYKIDPRQQQTSSEEPKKAEKPNDNKTKLGLFDNLKQKAKELWDKINTGKKTDKKQSMFEKIENSSPLTKGLLAVGAVLITGAVVVGAVMSAGIAVPAIVGAVAAGATALGLVSVSAGAWKVGKDTAPDTSLLSARLNNANDKSPQQAHNQAQNLSQSAELLIKSSESQKSNEVIFTPSKIDEKLGHKELKSVTLDELKSWKEKLDKKLKSKFGKDFTPNWEEVVKKDGHPRGVDPKSIIEEKVNSKSGKNEISH